MQTKRRIATGENKINRESRETCTLLVGGYLIQGKGRAETMIGREGEKREKGRSKSPGREERAGETKVT